MKIHLPVGLRKALLACLAATIVSLPATLGTASGVATFAAVMILMPQQVSAETLQVTDTNDWASLYGDVAGKGDHSAINEQGNTIEINLNPEAENYDFYLTDARATSADILADVLLSSDMLITNGFSPDDGHPSPTGYTVYNFKGAVSGENDIILNFVNHPNLSLQRYVFSGNLSAWSGNFENTNGNGSNVLEFNNSQGTFQSGTGNITLTSSNSTLLVDGVELKNASITASKLEIQNAVTFSGQTVTINGETTIGQGATLTLGANTEMHLASLAANSTLTTLTLGAGSELGLETGGLSIGTLVLAGDDASLAMDVTGGAHLSLTEFTDGGHTLTIHLSGLTETLVGTDGYDIFGGAWNSAWDGKIIVESDGRAVRLNESGKVVWAAERGSVTWTASDTAHELTWTNGGSGWDEQKNFNNGDDVTLNGSGSTALQVTVTGDILTGDLTISGETSGGFVFAAGEEGGSLTVEGNLNISADTTLNVSNDAATNLDVTAGSVTLDSATLTIYAASNQQYAVNAANTFHGTGESLTIEGTGTFKIDLSGTANSATFNAAGLSFAEGIVVECVGNAGWSNFENLNVQGTLKLTGHEIVLRGTNSINGTVDATGLTQDQGHITFDGGNVSTTFAQKLTMEHAGLDVRKGTVTLEQGADVFYYTQTGGSVTVNGDMEVTGVLGMQTSGGSSRDSTLRVEGTLKAKGGLSSLNLWMGTIEAGVLELANEDRQDYDGALRVSGDLTKTGAGEQIIHDGSEAFEVGGDVNVQAGILRVGAVGGSNNQHQTGTVNGALNVTGGQFIWQSGTNEGTLTVGSLNLSGSGSMLLDSGKLVVNGAITTGETCRLRIGYQATDAGRLTLSDRGGLTDGNHLYITFTGFEDHMEVFDGEGYRLFTEGGLPSGWEQYVTFDSVNNRRLTLTANGYVQWAQVSELQWNKDGDSDVWSDTATNWAGNVAWTDPNQIAVFEDATGRGETVLLNGALEAEGVKVNSGNDWHFRKDGSGGTLELYGDLEVADGAGLTIDADTRVTVGGSVNLHTSGSLKLASDLLIRGSVTGSGGSVSKADSAAGDIYVLWYVGASGETNDYAGKYAGNVLGAGVGYGVTGEENFTATIGGATSLNRVFNARGGTTTFTGAVTMEAGGAFLLTEGAKVILNGGTMAGETFTFTGASGSGNETVEIKGTNAGNVGVTVGEGLTLRLVDGSGWHDITSQGEVVIVKATGTGGDINVGGTNNVYKLSDEGSYAKMVVNAQVTVGEGGVNMANRLDVRSGFVEVTGDMVLGNGIYSYGGGSSRITAHKNVTLTVGEGYVGYMGSFNVEGTITKEGAGRQTFRGGDAKSLSSGGVNVLAGDLVWGADIDGHGNDWNGTQGVAELDAAIGQSGLRVAQDAHFYWAGRKLTLSGNIDAGNGELHLGDNSSVAVHSGTKAENTLGTLHLDGAQTSLEFVIEGETYTSLTLNGLDAQDHTLTVTLSGLEEYAQAHASTAAQGWEFDVFGLTGGGNDGVLQTLETMLQAGHLGLGNMGYSFRLTEEGALLIQQMAALVWTAGIENHGQALTWETGNTEGRWDDGGNFSDGTEVQFVGNGRASEVTVNGAVRTGRLTTRGEPGSTFVFTAGNGASLTVGGADLQVDTSFGMNLALQGGTVTVTLGDGVTLNMGHNSITLVNGTTGTVEGNGRVEFDRVGEGNGEAFVGTGITFGEGVTVHIASKDNPDLAHTNDYWSNVTNLKVLGILEADGMQYNFTGTNEVGTIVQAEGKHFHKLQVSGSASLTITGTDDIDLSEYTILNLTGGTLTKRTGKLSLVGISGTGTVDADSIELYTDEAKKGRVESLNFNGSFTLGGNLTMDGSWEQTIRGATMQVGGKVTVRAGDLIMGAAEANQNLTIGGALEVVGGSFTWVSTGTMTTKGLSVQGDGVVTLNGTAEINGEINTEGKVSIGTGGRLEANGGGTIGMLGADGGSLTVGDRQTLTVNDIDSGSGLSGLRIGTGATLNMPTASLTLSGTLGWGNGATLKMGDDSSQKLTLGSGFSLAGDNAGRLTVQLSVDYLNGLGGSGKGSFLNLHGVTWNNSWAESFTFATDAPRAFKNLHLNASGMLEWQEKAGVQWNGGDGDTWSSDKNDWVDANNPNQNAENGPNNQDVHFTDAAAGNVRLEGTLTPNNVYIESGNHSFMGNGQLNMSKEADGGYLVIGGFGEDADLVLGTGNVNLPYIELDDRGTLEVTNDEALTTAGEGGAKDTTKFKFMGGTLKYSQAGLENTDLSMHVAQEGEGSTDKAKIEVGKGYADGVTWGTKGAGIGDNGGLKLILDQRGLEKTGDGHFTLAWKAAASDEEHKAEMTVSAGTLTLEVNTEAGSATISGKNIVNGTLELKSTGVGGVNYSGSASGDGTLKISADKVTLSGANTVKNIELAAGCNTILESDDALGNSGTTLTLNGVRITGKEYSVKAGTVLVTEGAEVVIDGRLTFTGSTIRGEEGTLSLADRAAGTINATAMKEFSGVLNTGTNGTWSLISGNESAIVSAGVTGSGILETQGNGRVVLEGDLTTGAFTLRSAGSGALVVASPEVSGDVKLDTGGAGGSVVLGAASGAEAQVQWNSKAPVAGNGSIVFSNVRLADGSRFNKGDAKLLVDTVNAVVTTYAAERGRAGGVVDVNGMEVGKFDGITVNYGGLLTGIVGGTYKVTEGNGLHLCFRDENWGSVEEMEAGQLDALIEGSDYTLDFGNGEGINFEFNEGAIYKCFTSEGETDLYLHVRDGGEWINTPELKLWQSWLPGLVRKVRYTDDGYVVVTGSTDDIYLVADGGRDSETSDQPWLLEYRKATVVLDRKTLTLNWTGGTDKRMVVHNLLGTTGTELRVNNTAGKPSEQRLQLELDNTWAEEIFDSQYNAENMPKPDQTSVHGQHTSFQGKITGGIGVDILKTGKGTLTVGDNYTLADGTTTLREGALVLKGKENSMVNLDFAYTAKQDTEGYETLRGLKLDGGTTTVYGSIRDTENLEEGSEVRLENRAHLLLKGNSQLKDTDFIGGENGGTITLEGTEKTDERGAGLALGSGILRDVAVQLNGSNATLDIGSGASSVTSLNGSGTLKSLTGGVLSVSGGKFSGTLDSTGGTGGQLVVQKGVSFTLDNVKTAATEGEAAQGWGIKLEDSAGLTIDLRKMGAREHLTLGNVDLGNGNTTHILVNADNYNAEGNTITGNSLTFGEKTTIVLESVEGDWDTYRELTLGKYSEVNGQINISDAQLKELLDVQLQGYAFFLSEVETVTVEGGIVKIGLGKAEENRFLAAIPDGEKNAKAGAVMAWESLQNKAKPPSSPSDVLGSDTDYGRAMRGLVALVETPGHPGLERSLAALAGASISTLGPAVTEDVHRQLNAIRNRMTTMADEVTEETYDKLPLWHAWINAEGNYHKLDADSLAPGYTLNSWGGTVGVDADVSPYITVGLAISAMYGDLETDAADSATGSVDTTYLSAFLRAAKGSWVHSFVVTCGIAEVDLDRTVNYGSGSYSTNGSTDGYTFGAMYEVGYTGFVNKRGTAALQPVANVEVRHISLKGYSETGSDAGLTVDDMERTVLTFGVGARAQVAVGANAFNRTSVLESRALLKFDVGDRSGTARNAIIGDSTYAETESAEVGAVGVEVGVGISVPLGAQSGSVFADGSLEFRDGWTSANATLGYRVTF